MHENTPVLELKRKVSASRGDGGINHSSRQQPAAGSGVRSEGSWVSGVTEDLMAQSTCLKTQQSLLK